MVSVPGRVRRTVVVVDDVGPIAIGGSCTVFVTVRVTTCGGVEHLSMTAIVRMLPMSAAPICDVIVFTNRIS